MNTSSRLAEINKMAKTTGKRLGSAATEQDIIKSRTGASVTGQELKQIKAEKNTYSRPTIGQRIKRMTEWFSK